MAQRVRDSGRRVALMQFDQRDPDNLQRLFDDPEVREKQVQSIPMKRAAHPEEIANAAVFLASDDARYIHGTTLVIDGALTLYMGQGA